MRVIFFHVSTLIAFLGVTLILHAAEPDKQAEMRATLDRRDAIHKDYRSIIVALDDSIAKAEHVKKRLESMAESAKAGGLSEMDKAALGKVEQFYRIPKSDDESARIATAMAAVNERIASQTQNRNFSFKHMKENLFQKLKLEKELADTATSKPAMPLDKPPTGRVKSLIERFEKIAEENK